MRHDPPSSRVALPQLTQDSRKLAPLTSSCGISGLVCEFLEVFVVSAEREQEEEVATSVGASLRESAPAVRDARVSL